MYSKKGGDHLKGKAPRVTERNETVARAGECDMNLKTPGVQSSQAKRDEGLHTEVDKRGPKNRGSM